MSPATEPAGEQATGQHARAAASRWWWPFGGRAEPHTPQPADPAARHAGSQEAAAPVQEATAHAVEDRGYRTLLSPQTERDLPPADRRALLLEVYEAYLTNPLAHAVIELGTNFVLGGGVRVIAEDQRVQRIIDDFWQDADNRMDERIYGLLTELALFGEQFVRFFVDPLTGRTVVRQLDPLYVTEIETDPEDVERPLRYRYAPPPAGAAGPLPAEDTWIAAGEIEAAAVNKVSNATRGRSDLSTLLPWLRRYKDWLTDRVRINRYKGAFLYDVTLAGASRADLERKRAEMGRPPEPGTVLFHNESERWQAVNPQIGADDVSSDGRALKLMIAAGAGVPEHFLGEGGHVNRATAAEMGLPALKRFQRRQEYLRQLLVRIVRRAIQSRVRAGALGPRINQAFRVEFDELSDTERSVELGRAAATFTTALGTAVDRGWLESEQARRLLLRFLGEAAPERTARRA